MNQNMFLILASDGSQEALKFLREFQEWLDHADVVGVIWRSLQWGIVKILYTFASFAEKSVDAIFQLGGFLNYGPISTIYTSMVTIAFSIIVVMIMVMGFKTMLNIPPKLKSTTFRLIMIGCLMVGLPALMTAGLDISKAFFTESKSAGNTTPNSDSLAFSLIRDNTADLAFVATNDFAAFTDPNTIINAPGQSGVIIPEKNMLTEDLFGFVSMIDILTPDDVKKLKEDTGHDRVEYLGYRRTYSNGGIETAVPIKNGFFSMFDEGVFRYPANFGTIIIGLITLGFAYVMALFVLAQNLIELTFKKILFPIVAASDIETGQRTKKFLEDIGQSFLAIMLTGLSLRVFTIYYSFVATLGMNWFLFSVSSFVGAIVCMNGTNTIAKHFGVDVGVKDGLKGMLMMMAAGKLTKDAVTGAGKGAKNLAEKGIDATEAGFEKAKKSVNDTKEGVDKGAKKLGSELAQFEERGLSGYATDKKDAIKQAAQDKKEQAEEKAAEKMNALTQPVKDIKDNFEKGKEDGTVKSIQKNNEESMAEKEKASQAARNNETEGKERLSVRDEADGEVKKSAVQDIPRTGHLDKDSVTAVEDGEEKTISTSIPVPANQGEQAPLTPAEKVQEAMNSGSLGREVDRDNPTLSTSTTDGGRDLGTIKTEGVAKVEGTVQAEGEVKAQGTEEKTLSTMNGESGSTKVDLNGSGVSGATNVNLQETLQQTINHSDSNATNVNQTVQQNETKNVTETSQSNTTVQNTQSNQVTKNTSNESTMSGSSHKSGPSGSNRSKDHGNFDVNFEHLFEDE